jgi:hypothetical protein
MKMFILTQSGQMINLRNVSTIYVSEDEDGYFIGAIVYEKECDFKDSVTGESMVKYIISSSRDENIIKSRFNALAKRLAVNYDGFKG